MNAIKSAALHAVLLCAVVAIHLPSLAGGPADAALDRAVQQMRHDVAERGAWVNPYLPQGTGTYGPIARDATESADRILAATLRVYTREVLDRGGWINPWIAGDHYSAGQPLLAVSPGGGVTSVAAARFVAAQTPKRTAQAAQPMRAESMTVRRPDA